MDLQEMKRELENAVGWGRIEPQTRDWVLKQFEQQQQEIEDLKFALTIAKGQLDEYAEEIEELKMSEEKVQCIICEKQTADYVPDDVTVGTYWCSDCAEEHKKGSGENGR